MKYIIYMSSAIRLMSQDNLLDILTVSRKNNTENNLTGMLLYGEGTFVQVLEGEPETLKQTYERIQDDERHKNLIMVASGEITERNFPDWSMGFRAVNSDVVRQFEGFKDLRNNNPLNDVNNGHPAFTLLKTFVEINKLA